MDNRVNKKIIWLSRLSLLAVLLAWIVIGLGAYTRLSNAGLGCPDWPGCYGHFTVPSSSHINQPKAWAEMIHRYCAGTLGLLVISIALLALLTSATYGFRYLLLAMLLFTLIIYQAILGMWTVTLQLLPLIVTQHLLGGMTLIALLWLIYLHARSHPFLTQNTTSLIPLKPWAVIGLVLVALQIALGAWTSTNYAALSCPDFPYCHANLAQHFDFYHAFNLWSPIGVNYEGGRLESLARQTIQMIHRFGALIVTLYIVSMVTWILLKINHPPLRKIAFLLLIMLSIQIVLGTLNVILKLPLTIAVMHNVTATLLLLTIITLNFTVFTSRKECYES